MSGRQSVSQLASGDASVASLGARDAVCNDTGYGSGYGSGYGIGWFLLCWIILTVIFWLLLVAINPAFLRGGKSKGHNSKFDSSDSHDKKKKNGQCADHGRAFLAALVFSFFFIIILWAVYAATRGYGPKK